MIDLIVTPTLFTQDGIERTPTDNFEKVDDQFFHIELDGQITGFLVNDLTINNITYQSSDEAISTIRLIRNWSVDNL